jgi:hypothetical protein
MVFSLGVQQRLYNEDYRTEIMLLKDYNRKYSVEKRNTGRGSQWAWHQDEMIDGKPPVVINSDPDCG